MGHAAWTQLCEAIDEVFSEEIAPYVKGLKDIRSRYIEPEQSLLESRSMIDDSEYTVFDPITSRLRLNFLGLQLSNPSIVTDAGLNQFARHIGQFWFEKGMANTGDFIGFCMGASVEIKHLWAEIDVVGDRYLSFAEHADVIGNTFDVGGSYYPTTHVRMHFDAANFDTMLLPILSTLFYDVSNYNLVLEDMATAYIGWVLDADTTVIEEAVQGQPAVPANVLHVASFTQIEEIWFSDNY